tara:strand:+ start:460 stop:678 length:219 start_codon:yes stop_codon:yes gene_type:complete
MGKTKSMTYDDAEKAIDHAIEQCKTEGFDESKAIDILLHNETVAMYFTEDELLSIFDFELRSNLFEPSDTEH